MSHAVQARHSSPRSSWSSFSSWSHRPVVGVLLALCLAAPARVALAAPADPEQLLLQAEQHFERGEFRDSARAYAAFFRALPAEDQASPLGENAVFKAAEAYRRAYAAANDRTDLAESKALLETYLDAIERQTGRRDGPLAEYVAPELARVQEQLDALGPEPEADPGVPTPGPDEPSEPEQEITTTDDLSALDESPPRDDRAPSRLRPLGLGLTIGGAVLAATGAGLLVSGATILPRAERGLDQRGGSTPSDAGYLADARDLRDQLYIAGAVVAGTGVITLVAGVVLLARSGRNGEKRATAVRWEPGGGTPLRLRF